MRPLPKLSAERFFQGLGVAVILLAASTWPNVHWEGVIAGLGFIKAGEYAPGSRK
jgi:hypothetical protein